ncbi:uncharacterized protein LOC131160132 [Malania oleifera]|uniref:uncharacterized protein LOC131160132 n=1 Tax=Malania oleifera TaxID=397392 RepID=UPI0025AE9B39|nr:uncharacterized protein LOC131160132 [Malania oleifera]
MASPSPATSPAHSSSHSSSPSPAKPHHRRPLHIATYSTHARRQQQRRPLSRTLPLLSHGPHATAAAGAQAATTPTIPCTAPPNSGGHSLVLQVAAISILTSRSGGYC